MNVRGMNVHGGMCPDNMIVAYTESYIGLNIFYS